MVRASRRICCWGDLLQKAPLAVAYVLCNIRRLPVSRPSACDVIGSVYALQFMIHSTFVLVSLVCFKILCTYVRHSY